MLYLPHAFPHPTSEPISSDSRTIEHMARHKIRIFIGIKNVLMNYTERAVIALDMVQSLPPSSNGVWETNPLEKLTTRQAIREVCCGYDFYNKSSKYKWSDTLWQRLFQLSSGHIHPLVRHNDHDMEGLGGKANWIVRNFGTLGYNNMILISDSHNFPFSDFLYPHHLLVDSDLTNIEKWCKQGGTGYLWKEIDDRAPQGVTSQIVAQRFIELEQFVNAMLVPQLVSDLEVYINRNKLMTAFGQPMGSSDIS